MSRNIGYQLEIKEVFTAYLKKRELKITPERFLILSEILSTDDHFQPDELVQLLHNKNIKISRATVYRTLDLLIDCGIVNRVSITNGINLYESRLRSGNHDHFICRNCRKIIEFYADDIKSIHSRIETELNLKIENYTHQLYGICNECLNHLNPEEN